MTHGEQVPPSIRLTADQLKSLYRAVRTRCSVVVFIGEIDPVGIERMGGVRGQVGMGCLDNGHGSG
jgi:AAA+ superfamily predicted ATPase